LDQTEREALRSAMAILDGAPVGIFLTTAKGDCTYVNPVWCGLSGLSPEKCSGDGWAAALHPDDRDRVFAEWKAGATAGRPFHSEYRFKRTDGSIVHLVGRAQLAKGPNGEDVYIGSVTDITERKRAEQARNELISVVSHELRGPLAAVHGALGYLQSGTVSGKEERRELLEMAVRNSKFLSHLVDDLLIFERLASDSVRVQLEEVELHELTAEAVAMSRQRAHAESREIHVAADTGVFVADRRRILQVLTNLIGNALKFSDPGEIVSVTASISPQETVFSISDQGRGIPQHMVEQIFQPFEQVDAEDHNRLGGAGLGLAISKAIVDRHEGRIWVESRVDSGSTFFVSLPTAGPAGDG
jgi:PAS domain S-box-containing protein